MNTPNVAHRLGNLAIQREQEAAKPDLSPAERSRLLWLADQYRIARAEVLAAINPASDEHNAQLNTLRGINHAISQFLPSLRK